MDRIRHTQAVNILNNVHNRLGSEPKSDRALIMAFRKVNGLSNANITITRGLLDKVIAEYKRDRA